MGLGRAALLPVLVLGLCPSGRAEGAGSPAIETSGAATRGEIPRLHASATADAPSRDGTFMLEWGDPADQRAGLAAAATEDGAAGSRARLYHVQIAAPPDPETYLDWYRGTALESFVSGIPSGEVKVRVRARALAEGANTDGAAGWSAWSEPLVVPVEHHSLQKALVLLGLGFLVFLTIAGYVLAVAFRPFRDGPVRSEGPPDRNGSGPTQGPIQRREVQG